MGRSWVDWELVFKLINWGHGEAVGGRDLILGLQNSHIMNLWVNFQACWELSSVTRGDLRIQYCLERHVNVRCASFIQTQERDCECF